MKVVSALIAVVVHATAATVVVAASYGEGAYGAGLYGSGTVIQTPLGDLPVTGAGLLTLGAATAFGASTGLMIYARQRGRERRQKALDPSTSSGQAPRR